jgi:acetyl-CoA carboxylase biotin carboxyl carrier protein
MAKFNVDPELVKKLAALLEETGLTEIEYAVGEQRIRVAKTASAVQNVAVTAPASPAAAAPGVPAAAGGPHPGAVTAPMVGTVYLSPEPGAQPFIRVGDTVAEGQTLVLIEAMKTYNPVRAARAGKVARILVADGDPVEYGQELVILT